jgi:hypothetical protein
MTAKISHQLRSVINASTPPLFPHSHHFRDNTIKALQNVIMDTKIASKYPSMIFLNESDVQKYHCGSKVQCLACNGQWFLSQIIWLYIIVSVLIVPLIAFQTYYITTAGEGLQIPILSTYGRQPIAVRVLLRPNAWWNTGPPFLRSYPKGPWFLQDKIMK